MFKKKLLVLMLIFSFLLPFSFVSAEIGDITIDNWESYNLGVSSGTGTFGTWETTDAGGDGIITTGARSGNCVSFDYTDSSATYFWYNLTEDYEYIGKISMWFELGSGDPDKRFVVQFYNDTDMVLSFKMTKPAFMEWQAYTIDSGWQDLNHSASGTDDGWFNITHVSGNTMNYTFWDSNNPSYTSYYEGASHNTADWKNITRIYIYTNSGDCVFLLDDIIINTNEASESNLEITGVSCIGCCNNFELGEYAHFDIGVLGDIGEYTFQDGHWIIPTSKATFTIQNESGVYIYGETLDVGVHSIDVWFPYKYRNGTYTMIIKDWNYIFDNSLYYESCNFTVGTEYTEGEWFDIYNIPEGETFIGFVNQDNYCEYEIGERFKIVYYLNSSDFTEGDLARINIAQDNGAGFYTDPFYVFKSYTFDQIIVYEVPKLIDVENSFIAKIWEGTNETTYGIIPITQSETVYTCSDVEKTNVYDIIINPSYTSYNRSLSINITFSKVGNDVGFYIVDSPATGFVTSGKLTIPSKTIEINFSDYGDSHIGQWLVRLYDDGGSISDSNAMRKSFYVVDSESEVKDDLDFSGLPYFVPFVIGGTLVLLFTMLPLILATYISRNKSFKEVKIPAIVYVGFFFVGLVMAVLLNLLPIYLVFIVLFAMIIFYGLQYYSNSAKSGE